MTIYIECMEKRRKKRAPFVCLLTEKFMDPDGIEETQFHLIHCKIIQAPLPNRSPFDYAKRIGLSCIATKFLRIKQNFSRCCSVFFFWERLVNFTEFWCRYHEIVAVKVETVFVVLIRNGKKNLASMCISS